MQKIDDFKKNYIAIKECLFYRNNKKPLKFKVFWVAWVSISVMSKYTVLYIQTPVLTEVPGEV